MSQSIKLIAVDLDKTLLNNQHEISERNTQAIKAAQDAGLQVIFATGKTRGSALGLLDKLKLYTPGIYVQGIVTHNGDGSIRNQLTLDAATVRRVITFAEDRGFSLIAYSGTRMLVRRRNHHTDLVMEYDEPEPEEVGAIQNLLYNTPINKVLILDRNNARGIKALRWQLEMQLDGAARVMQAGVPEMVEVLPRGASKGTALKALLRDLHIDAAQVMAIGDGENDIEMIRLAGIGVAIGNADAEVKEAADHVVASNEEDGVAEAIERFALPKPPTPSKPKAEAPSSAAEPVTDINAEADTPSQDSTPPTASETDAPVNEETI